MRSRDIEGVSIRRSAADRALNFRKLIKLAHVRYVRRTNKGDVETSSPIPARSLPSFSFLAIGMRGWDTIQAGQARKQWL